jgi:hypothetical protein
MDSDSRSAGGDGSDDPTTVAALIPDPANRRTHSDRNVEMIAASLRSVGAARSIVIDEANEVLAGNGVLQGAARAGISKLHVVDVDGDTVVAVRRRGLTPEQKRDLAIYDNRSAELAAWDIDQLRADVNAGLDLQPFFFPEELVSLFGEGGVGGTSGAGSLIERFGVPPFSVLDARQGYWQDRKRAWLALGIESELGRGGDIVPNGTTRPPEQARGGASPGGSPRPAMKIKHGKTQRGDGRGRPLPGAGD